MLEITIIVKIDFNKSSQWASNSTFLDLFANAFFFNNTFHNLFEKFFTYHWLQNEQWHWQNQNKDLSFKTYFLENESVTCMQCSVSSIGSWKWNLLKTHVNSINSVNSMSIWGVKISIILVSEEETPTWWKKKRKTKHKKKKLKINKQFQICSCNCCWPIDTTYHVLLQIAIFTPKNLQKLIKKGNQHLQHKKFHLSSLCLKFIMQ